MGLLAPGRDENVGCITWVLGGLLLIGLGIAAIFSGCVDAIF